jgi:glycosyltransferase involved in cell wall biosynthesis
MSEAVAVIPCFNEERRLDANEVLRLASAVGVRVIAVDDGSSDGTRFKLEHMSEQAGEGRLEVLALSKNVGKAEAVRRGLLHALDAGARWVGYLDADFSTPADEWLRLLEGARLSGAQAVLGSRVKRAGAQIDRQVTRHLTGRVFATAASLVLRQSFYDTQCGAKLFRDSSALRDALSRTFHSRWAFDVELLGRLLTAPEPLPFEAFAEVPLQRWRDVGGSKLGVIGMVRATLDLARIEVELEMRRRR